MWPRILASETDKRDDTTLAVQIADGAGRVLTAMRHEGLLTGRALGDAGDALAQAWIAAVLAAHRPGDAVLSEEAADDPRRIHNSRVWIIDPLDGTREYSCGREDFAVHVALTVDGEPVDCAVALPAAGMVFDTASVPHTSGELSGVIATSRFSDSYEAAYVARELGLRAARMGSAGVKAMAVVRGEADCYIHSGGQYEWDSCAPVGVAAAAGLHCSRLDGSPLRYNRADPYLPDFVIARKEIADDILRIIGRIS